VLLADNRMGDPIRRVVQTSRQYGIFIIAACQSANATVINTPTRDNFVARLCFRTSPTSGKVVLDTRDVAQLAPPGRALLQLAGRPTTEIQAGLVDKAEFLRALTGGGPKKVMPIVDVVPQVDNTDARITQMYDNGNGMSRSAISTELFGRASGDDYYKVKRVIDRIDSSSKGE